MMDKRLIKLLRNNEIDYAKDKPDIFFENNLVEIKNRVAEQRKSKSFLNIKRLTLAFASFIIIVIPVILLLSGVFSTDGRLDRKGIAISYEKANFLEDKNLYLVELARTGSESAKFELFSNIYYDLANNYTFDVSNAAEYDVSYDSDYTYSRKSIKTEKRENRLSRLAYAYTEYLVSGSTDI